MRMKIYDLLVNRHSGIADRYHRFHNNSGTVRKWISYFYLLLLNFCYYVLFCRFLGVPREERIYEEKRLIVDRTESEMRMSEGLSVQETVDILAGYDIVSFDIFDTLLFRPFDDPTALFFLLGEKLKFMDFRRIRIEAEQEARQEKYKRTASYEVNLEEIWSRLEEKTGLPAKPGMELEVELERCYCYANPFMLRVFRRLAEAGKKIIITSDMYLSEKFLKSLLEEKGFAGAEKIYISNEWGGSKYSGRLYELVLRDLNAGRKQVVHIGDNRRSDVQMAKKHGLVSLLYPNVHKKAALFRAYDMSPIVGAAYRGLVDSHLYCGLEAFSPEYEYGYIYGGLFVVGYCSFIHEYCRLHQTDKVLFLSRDGDILSRVYRMLYPDENAEYVYWSRKAALKLMASSDRYDYFRRFLNHKVNQKISLEEIFQSMELETLLDDLLTQTGKGALHRSDHLTSENLTEVTSLLTANWQRVLACYREEHEAAAAYYGKVLSGCRKAAAVDIGWAGSGAVALKTLVEKVWKLPCSITGIIAGTNTLHNAEPFASETFLQTGDLVAYMYSLSHNRDLVKKHDPNKNYNVYWELLLSSPTRQFTGFGFRQDGTGISEDFGRRADAVELHFGKSDENQKGIREIQRGILDFAGQYLEHFGNTPYLFRISGRDAYAPMLAAAGHKEKYLKAMEKRFSPEIQVN
ncbi:MAG: HAD-IA family hydrolase [Firmicutes bacterium]|nr:HAD-IA family hydrolase [Bacillota bacterium]